MVALWKHRLLSPVPGLSDLNSLEGGWEKKKSVLLRSSPLMSVQFVREHTGRVRAHRESLLSIAVINTMTTSNLRRRGFISPHSLLAFTKGSWGRKSRQEPASSN